MRLLPVALALLLASVPGPLVAADLAPTTTTLSAPAVAHYPNRISVTASVAPSTSGNVLVRTGNTALASGSLSNGQMTRAVVLAPGAHALAADFQGSQSHAPSTSAAASVQSLVQTATHLHASTASAFFGERIKLHAQTEVAGSYQLTGGTLSIVDLASGETLASAAAQDGEIEVGVETRLFEAGTTRQFEARYSGHGLLAPSTRQTSLKTKKRPTWVTLEGPGQPVFPGPFTYTATVSPVPESGNIVFARSYEPLGTVPLDRHGRASISVHLDPGPGFVSATFSGSPGYVDSWTSKPVTVRVATQVELSVSPASPKAGESIHLSGVVRPLHGAPAVGSGVLTLSHVESGEVLAKTYVDLQPEVTADVVLPAGQQTIKLRYFHQHEYNLPDEAYYFTSEQHVAITVAGAPDTTPPAGSITINSGKAFTNQPVVTLGLSATDTGGSGLTQMSFSSTGQGGSWTAWEPYKTARSWAVAGPDGDKRVFVRFRDAAGNVSSAVSSSIVLDTQAPLQVVPRESVAAGLPMGSKVALAVDFGTTDEGSGVSAYRLAQSSNGGNSYGAVTLASGQTTVTRKLAPGSTVYRFRTRATDGAGNQSPWSYGPKFTVRRLQEGAKSVTYSGSWSSKSKASASGGKFRQSSSAGAKATLTFSGRGVAFVTRVGPDMGKAGVFVDGQKQAELDLYAPSAGWRRVVFSRSFAGVGSHTMEVRVLGSKNGSSSGTRVIVDAFVVIK